jgi:hypothetical protein
MAPGCITLFWCFYDRLVVRRPVMDLGWLTAPGPAMT